MYRPGESNSMDLRGEILLVPLCGVKRCREEMCKEIIKIECVCGGGGRRGELVRERRGENRRGRRCI